MEPRARTRLLQRGGANNRSDRVSWQLKRRDCEKLIAVCRHASAMGRPLNRFVTIAWGKAGIPAEGSVTATGQFVKRARDWLGWHGYPMPWCWVQEHGNKFGQHCHLLLHVEPLMDELFRPMPLRWLKAILPTEYVGGTLQTQKLCSARSASHYPDAYRAELMGKVHYMLKTAPGSLEEPLGMLGWGYKPWGQSCRVIGKRAAVWQGVGESSDPADGNRLGSP